MYKSFIKRQESDRKLQSMCNRLGKLKKDIEKTEKNIQAQEQKHSSHRKARELYNKDLHIKMSEKKRRMEALRQENQRIRDLYQFRYILIPKVNLMIYIGKVIINILDRIL